MDDIDHDKAAGILEQLETEKARRLQAKIDSGEIVSIQTVVVVGRDESAEEATTRALARQPIPDDGRPVHRELFFVFTGVPRDPDYWKEETVQRRLTLPLKKGLPLTLLRSRLRAGASPARSQPMCG